MLLSLTGIGGLNHIGPQVVHQTIAENNNLVLDPMTLIIKY